VSIYLDEFETLYGISDNIEKLRSKILDYAFKGKLIKNNKSEKSAKDLVKSIRKSRKEMIENKEIRKPRGGVDSVDLDKAPHSIPDYWEWDKIGYIFNIYNGDSINRKLKERKYMKVKEGYDYIGTKDVGYHGEINYKTDVKIPFDEKDDFSIAPPNRPLICCEGGSAGKKIGFTDNYISFGNKLFAVESFGNFNYKFLFYYYQSNTFYEQFKSKLKGVIGGVSMGRFREIYLPIPPLEEQKRIVDKIEKLMKEVDKLETKLEKKEDISQNLSESIVEAIKNSQDAQELKEKLRFIIDNFDVIFKTSESMDEMKNIVLQLAIEGKLVSQNENDEPASELIDKIKRKREELVKKGESRNINKKINEINKDELPFDIPDNWSWVRLGNLTKQITDGTHQTPNYIEEGVPFLSVKNISQGYLDKDDIKYISKEEHLELIKRCKPEKGDILFCRIGTLGKALKLRDNFEFSIFVSLGLLKFVDNSLGDYLEKFLNSPEFYRQIEIVKVGGSHTNKINLRDVPNFLIPIPPLEEQKIIVNKVNSIMSIIDKLEKELIKKEDLVEKLGSI